MKVTVIGRHTCQPCRATMRRLQSAPVYSRFVDVDDVTGTIWEHWVHNVAPGASLPIVVVQDDLGLYTATWYGYRPDRIDALATAR